MLQVKIATGCIFQMPIALFVRCAGHLRAEDTRTSGSSSIDLYHGDVYIHKMFVDRATGPSCWE